MAEAPPEIPVFAWQDARFEWLWVYRAASAKQEVWSAAADVPNGVFFVEKGRVDIEAHGRRFAVPAVARCSERNRAVDASRLSPLA
jgi:hypothetical protein